jgi:hypothetical protein
MKRMGLFVQDLNVELSCINCNWKPKIIGWWFKIQIKLKSSWQIMNLKPELKPKTMTRVGSFYRIEMFNSNVLNKIESQKEEDDG